MATASNPVFYAFIADAVPSSDLTGANAWLFILVPIILLALQIGDSNIGQAAGIIHSIVRHARRATTCYNSLLEKIFQTIYKTTPNALN